MRDSASGDKRTLVEAGTEVKGTISSTCPIVVNGRIEGNVSGPSLHVSETGAVSGSVKVKTVQSRGELEGEFDADEVQLSGRVKDKTVIRARALEVKLGQRDGNGRMEIVFGECQLEVGDEPSKEQAIADALRKPEAAGGDGWGDEERREGDTIETQLGDDGEPAEGESKRRRARRNSGPQPPV